MSVPGYLPATPEGVLTHVAEECAEVIKTICKIQRFGWHNGHYNNAIELRMELRDLKDAVDRLYDVWPVEQG